MELNLKNPLVFLDLETTGINIVTDRIVEIALLKIFPGGKQDEKLMLINPEMPIPAQSSAIHGIKDEDVKDAPTFKEVANWPGSTPTGSIYHCFRKNSCGRKWTLI
jgi:DNA polymerase-3 subunit epsilon